MNACDRAQCIVRGTVVEQVGSYDAGRDGIFTDHKLLVHAWYKGTQLPNSELFVRTAGGAAEGHAEIVIGLLHPRVGEEWIAFADSCAPHLWMSHQNFACRVVRDSIHCASGAIPRGPLAAFEDSLALYLAPHDPTWQVSAASLVVTARVDSVVFDRRVVQLFPLEVHKRPRAQQNLLGHILLIGAADDHPGVFFGRSQSTFVPGETVTVFLRPAPDGSWVLTPSIYSTWNVEGALRVVRSDSPSCDRPIRLAEMSPERLQAAINR